jgi:hypothetical protein
VCQSCSTQAVPREHFLKCDVRCGNFHGGAGCVVSVFHCHVTQTARLRPPVNAVGSRLE